MRAKGATDIERHQYVTELVASIQENSDPYLSRFQQEGKIYVKNTGHYFFYQGSRKKSDMKDSYCAVFFGVLGLCELYSSYQKTSVKTFILGLTLLAGSVYLITNGSRRTVERIINFASDFFKTSTERERTSHNSSSQETSAPDVAHLFS